MTKQFRLSPRDLDILLTAAGRAPSGGNIQPWLVEVNQNTIITKLNPKKLGTILDINNYGSLFALGAFCQNLEIAAAKLGLIFEKDIINPKDVNKFQIAYQFTHTGTSQPAPLYQAVLARDTNRKLHQGKLIEDKSITTLSEYTKSSSTKLRLDAISDTHTKSEIANILGKADMIRTKNLTLLKQMMSEMRWTQAEANQTKDGLDLKTMELPGNVGKMLKLLSKFPSMATAVPEKALEKQALPLLKNSSHLCVLTLLSKPTPEKFFQVGSAMQQIWLEATRLNIAIHPWTVFTFFVIRARFFSGSFFNQKEEKLLITMDKKLKTLLKLPQSSTPAFIFRLSYAKPPTARSARYPWIKYTTIHK